jgi:hypothetical protein
MKIGQIHTLVDGTKIKAVKKNGLTVCKDDCAAYGKGEMVDCCAACQEGKFARALAGKPPAVKFIVVR